MPMANRPWVLGMASFSSTEAAFEGFRLTREHPLAVLGWIVAYFAFSLALAVLAVVWGAGEDLAALRAVSQGANPDLAAMTQVIDKLAPYVLLAMPLQVTFFAVLNCAIYRAVLRPYERGLGYFMLGADEFRMVALGIILFVIWLVAIFAVTLVASFAAGTLGLLGGVAGPLAGAAIAIAAFCAAIWVLVRLSLAAPMTFAERRLVVFGSWSFTRGKFWSLVGAYVVAFMLGVLVLFLLGLIFSAAIVLTGASHAFGALEPDACSLKAFLTVPTLLSEALERGHDHRLLRDPAVPLGHRLPRPGRHGHPPGSVRVGRFALLPLREKALWRCEGRAGRRRHPSVFAYTPILRVNGAYAAALGRAVTRACQAFSRAQSSGIFRSIQSAKSMLDRAQMSAIE